MNLAITLDLFQVISILLVLVFLFLGFKVWELKWSYKLSKPHKWEEANRNGKISGNLKKLERTYRDKVRFYTFWLQIERLKNERILGDFAELGVYKGETAKIIHEMDSSRTFHLFDTFSGFDKQDLLLENSTDEKFSTSNFSDTNLEVVKRSINGNENVHFHPGYFPDSVKNLDETNYAFVHLDADLYKPTLAALNYFYPKLSTGGVIIIHDYNHTWNGIPKAVDEFVQSISETIVELADWQGSVMIVKSSN
ncbi:MAG: class I SAM-dependent methyltransferase [Bacteroidia bacterium]|nr:class I SAM-dependent methyltransferase [Bacteroidia bacterium]